MITGRFRPGLLKRKMVRLAAHGVIFSARLVSGYTIPGFSATSGPTKPLRDLLAPSWPLHRNITTENDKIQLSKNSLI